MSPHWVYKKCMFPSWRKHANSMVGKQVLELLYIVYDLKLRKPSVLLPWKRTPCEPLLMDHYSFLQPWHCPGFELMAVCHKKFISSHLSREVSLGLVWGDQPWLNKKISVSGHKARHKNMSEPLCNILPHRIKNSECSQL